MRRLCVIPDMEFTGVLAGLGMQHINPAGKLANRYRLRTWLDQASRLPAPAAPPEPEKEEVPDGVPRVSEPPSDRAGGVGDALPPAV